MSRANPHATNCVVCYVDTGRASYRPPQLLSHASVGDVLLSQRFLTGRDVPSNPPLCPQCLWFVTMIDKGRSYVQDIVDELFERRLSSEEEFDEADDAPRVVSSRKGELTSQMIEWAHLTVM